MWLLVVLFKKLFLITLLCIFLFTRNNSRNKVEGVNLQSFLQNFDQVELIICSSSGRSNNLGLTMTQFQDDRVKQSRFKSRHILLQCGNETTTSPHFLWPYLLGHDYTQLSQFVVLFEPEDEVSALKFLDKISQFYEKRRQHASFVYFLISWPTPTDDKTDSDHAIKKLEALSNSLTDVLLPLNSRCYFFLMNGLPSSANDNSIKFWELYSIKGTIVLQPVNILDPATDLVSIVTRRSDFRGANITAVAKREDSLSILAFFHVINGTEFLAGGLAVDMLLTISDHMNFTLRAIKAKGWISELPDGNVGGMGQQLVEKKADMTLQYSDLLMYRLRKLGISQPTYTFRLYGYFRKPPPSLYRNIYINAFKMDLRIAICSSWILIITSLLFIAYYKKKQEDHHHQSKDDMDQKIVSNVVLWAVGTACQKGWDYSPSSASLRIIVFISLLSGLLYYTAYSASIVAIFSVEVNPFQGFSDLVKRGFTIYGNELSVASYQYVKDQARKDGVSSYMRMLRPEEAMKKISTSQSAVLSSAPTMLPFVIRANYSQIELCTWLTSVEAGKESNVIYFQKFDPFKKFIGYRLSHWKEKGLLFHQQTVYNRQSVQKCVEKEREPTALGFKDIQSAFFIIVTGFFICLTILVYELVSFRTFSRRRSKTYFCD